MSDRCFVWMAAAVLACSAVNGQSPAAADKERKERALGMALGAQLERDYPVVGDAALNQYLASIAAPLAQAAGLRAQVTIKVLESSRPLASALPGRIVYIGTGLLSGADGGVVANVLAHEIAHIAARHGTMQRGTVANVASVPLIFMAGWMGMCARYNDGSVQVPVGFVQQQAGYEKEADGLAAEYVSASGYDISPPQAPPAVRVRQKVESPPTLRRPSEAPSRP